LTGSARSGGRRAGERRLGGGPSTSPAARLPARVRWRKPGRSESGEAVIFGITFGKMPRADQALLRSALQEFRRRAALVA
jgi:hypothetical protein